jgi:parallel beta helix pectate lyase-like protein/di-heme oxidoreductase (putative peroxidase)
LGPVFNGTSCVGCHNVGATGGCSEVVETRFGAGAAGAFDSPSKHFDPLSEHGGSLIQTDGIGLSDRRVPAGIGPQCLQLRRRGGSGRGDDRCLAPDHAVFGLGARGRRPDADLVALANQQKDETPKTAGQTNMVIDITTGEMAVGKFGWKSQVPNLRQFSGDAHLNEMAITTPMFPEENCPQGKSHRSDVPAPRENSVDRDKHGSAAAPGRLRGLQDRRLMRGPTLCALRASLACAVCVLGMFAQAPVAAARDVWVDHDSRGGPCDDARTAAQNSMTAPWCTLAAAGNKAEPGDTVRVRGGEYTERHGCGDGCWNLAVLDIVHAGRSDAWIRFVAEPGEDVHITPAGGAVHGILIKAPDGAARNWYVEISGFHISGFSQVDETNGSGICVSLRNAADVTLRNLEVTNCGGGGAIGMHLSGRITVEGCDVHDNHTHGWTTPMNLYRCRPGNVIRGNRIWNNEDDPPDWCRAGGGQCPDSEGHGIIMDYCVENDGGAIIENNVLWDNEGLCIVVFHSDHARIQNNVCYKNARRADGGEISVFGNDVTLFNNIAVPRPGQFGLDMNYDQDSIYRVDESTLNENHNIIWAPDHANIMAYGNNQLVTLEQYRLAVPGGWSSKTLFADPMFNNADAHDFTLRAGSPAIDSGDNAHAAAVDITGGARPADGDGNGSSVVDRGAYEIGARASTSPTIPTIPTTTTITTTTTTTSTTLPALCGPAAASGCRLAASAKASLQVRRFADPAKNGFKWVWNKGATTALADFEDPVSGSATMQVCLYDASGASQPLASMALLPGGTCGTKPCWTASGTSTFKYGNKAGTPNGLMKGQFKAGLAGKPKISASGKGVHLPLPSLPLTLPVTVQLLIDKGVTSQCWQTTYSVAATNTAAQFKAKGP